MHFMHFFLKTQAGVSKRCFGAPAFGDDFFLLIMWMRIIYPKIVANYCRYIFQENLNSF